MSEIIETIVLAPTAKSAELLKSLAKAGVNTFGVRIVSSSELACIALERNGISIKEDFIAESNQAFLIYNELKEIDYFKQYVYADAWELMKSINEFRKYISKDTCIIDLKEDSFKNKNQSIKKAFSLYLNKLKENNLVDEIALIRKAIDSKCELNNVKFLIYDEFHLTPLDKLLINVVSKGNYETIHLSDLSKNLKIESYTKAFGSTNEIENILSYINDKRLLLDECEVVVSDSTLYSKILTNYRDLLDFNLSIGVSESLNNTNVGKLFYSFDDWNEHLYFLDYLSKIMNASYFNSELFKQDIGFDEDNIPINKSLNYQKQINFDCIIAYLGNLRISFNQNENNEKVDKLINIVNHQLERNSTKKDLLREQIILGYVNNAKIIFNRGFAYFLERYTYIIKKDSSREYNVLSSVVNLLSLAEKHNVAYKEIRSSVASILAGASLSESGKLYVTTISKAKSIIRPYMFIVGLSNNYYPGGPKEDPIFLDEDYEQFGEKNHSSNKITEKKHDLVSLIYLANTYAKEVHVSYSTYNTETLKDQSCSSGLLDIYKRENGDGKSLSDFNNEFIKNKKKFKSVSFFSTDLLSDHLVGKAVVENKIIEPHIEEKEAVDKQSIANYKSISLSASRVETYVKCPYQFYLKYVLNLPDPVENDMFEVMSAIDSGNLAHNLLENFQKHNIPGEEEKLLEDAKVSLDKYFLSHPTKNSLGEENKREEFLEMIRNAYDMDEGYQNLLAEQDLSCVHKESGLKIHGYPDKVVITKDNELKIIDFKTKNKIDHDFSDPSSIVQLVMYSYIIEHTDDLKYMNKENYKVRELEYRYLKLHEGPHGNDIEKYYIDFSNQLNDLKLSFETGSFVKKKKNCRFCKFKELCKPGEKNDG